MNNNLKVTNPLLEINLDVQVVIESLRAKKVIEPTANVMNKLSGSTDGLVYTLAENEEPKYVLKFDDQNRNSFVKRVYQTYSQTVLLPKLLYSDHNNEFIVYTFIPGTTRYNRGLKKNWLARLVKELLNQYTIYPGSDVWGSLERPCQSWREFNEQCLKEARRNFERSLSDPRIKIEGKLPIEDFNKVQTLVERISEVDDKYLLHGDTGVHNFVFHDCELVGVIDPWPTIGPIIYDFTYAYCSSPDDLTLETLYDAFDLLNIKIEKSRLIDEVLFRLYCRIGVCSRVHPKDLKNYLEAWEYWKIHLYGSNDLKLS